MKTYKEFLDSIDAMTLEEYRELYREAIEDLNEMPHLQLDTGNVIDLELEVHSKMKEKDYLQYFRDWLKGKEIESKMPGSTFSLSSRREKKEFAEYLLNSPAIENFTRKYYSDTTWSKLEQLALKYT